MGFVYILSNENRIIDFTKISSERYSLLSELAGLGDGLPLDTLIPVQIDSSVIEERITELLAERQITNSTFPEYEGRFGEEEIFTRLVFNGNTINLCLTGFDNKIIFLINIYNELINENSNSLSLLHVSNHRAFEEYVNKVR